MRKRECAARARAERHTNLRRASPGDPIEFFKASVRIAKGKLADEKAKLEKKRKRSKSLLDKSKYPDAFVFDEGKVRRE